MLGGRGRRGADAYRIGGLAVKRCRGCGSFHVRRSGLHPSEARLHPLKSPYRCLDCNERFWVISRRTRLAAAAIGVLAVAIAAAILVSTDWEEAESRTAATTLVGPQKQEEQVLFDPNGQGIVVVRRNRSELFAKEQPLLDAGSPGSADILSQDHSELMSRKLQTSVLTPLPEPSSP